MTLRLTIWTLIALLLLISQAEAQSVSNLTEHIPSLNQDGNCIVAGRGTFPAVERLTLNLDQQPLWLDRYPHNVLGNSLEAAGLLIFTSEKDALIETARAWLPDHEVFEGLSPMWADVDADGSDELATTVSNANQGSRLVIYRTDGTLLAESPAIGQGYRWRRQLTFGAFGPNGEMEIAEVQTPHIGTVVQFWRFEPDQLRLALFEG